MLWMCELANVQIKYNVGFHPHIRKFAHFHICFNISENFRISIIFLYLMYEDRRRYFKTLTKNIQ